jgi:DNA-binding CsgD family transcriptional regulator
MRDEHSAAQIDIHHRPDRDPFGAHDLAAFDPLMAQIGRAVLDGLAGTLAAAVDDLPGGVVVLDRGGHVEHVNRAARAIVARRDGIGLDRHGAVVLAASDAARAFAALLAGVLHQGAAGGTLRVPRRSGRAPYTLLVAPQPGPHGLRDAGVAAPPDGATLLIHDPDRRMLPPPGMLRQVFGLTRREAELVESLISGIGTAGFAAQGGISVNTVRYHLKSIYAKVGVRGQADLLRTVLTTLAVLGGERHARLWRAGTSRERQIRRRP